MCIYMSNNEIFEFIFENISNKIIKQYLTNVDIVRDENIYRYSNNIRVIQVINALNDNLFKITNYLMKQMQIKDKESLEKILKEHINSEYFKKSLNQLEATIETKKRLDINDIRKTYSQHLKYFLISRDVKAKIFALSKDTTFSGWIERRWKVIGCGYLLVILVLAISYYVFISK